MSRQTLVEYYTFRPLGTPTITESGDGSGRKVYRRSGVFQNYLRTNCNGRQYPKPIWDRTFSESSRFSRRLKERSVLGFLEHPSDGQSRLDRSPALLVVEVHIARPDEIKESINRKDPLPLEEGDIVGTFEILGTRSGLELQALDEANVTYGVSSRGTGTVKESGGAAIVQDDFELETWDAVFNPSVERALPVRTEDQTSDKAEETVKPAADTHKFQPAQAEESATEPGLSAGPEKPNLQETKPPMNKLHEMRTLESQIVQLTATNAKGLNVSAKASLLHTVTEQRVAIDRLVVEDPALRTIANRLHRRLTEFENDVSAAPAPAPAPSKAPAAMAPTDTPAGDDPAGGEDVPEDQLLRQAADMLQDKLADDPDAADLAAKLTKLADEKAPDSDPNAAPDADPAPAATDSDPAAPVAAAEARYNRLLKATATVLERYQALKESISAEGLGEDGSAPRSVGVKLLAEKNAAESKAAEWEKSARDLAAQYNHDMIEMGLKHWSMKRPDLFEKTEIKEQLTAADTFEKFTEVSEKILKENAVEDEKETPNAAEAVKPDTETAPAPAKEEAAPAKEESKPATEAAPLVEDAAAAKVHPQIAHIRRVRTNGTQWSSR